MHDFSEFRESIRGEVKKLSTKKKRRSSVSRRMHRNRESSHRNRENSNSSESLSDDSERSYCDYKSKSKGFFKTLRNDVQDSEIQYAQNLKNLKIENKKLKEA